ncbi:FecR family protein [Mucilaginibacter terrae]|uniref:FecR family protein n=1 Tax=Mucilaginibacter terrae TaxID=1955052 RepID=UPI003645F0C7
MKIKNNPVITQLFANYQNGSIGHDKQVIDNWFDSHRGVDLKDTFASAADENRIHAELTERIKACINDTPARNLWYKSIWLKAACVVALVSIAAILTIKNKQQAPVTEQISYQTITTENGQVKKVSLDDGTQVWLNAASRLRFARLFNTGKQRTVYLDKGEAYFEVKHDDKHPFRVLSAGFQTTVLGTSFNVKAYHIEKEYKVAVASGMVSVGIIGKNGQYRALSNGLVKGQVLKYQSIQKQVLITQSTVTSPFAWINGGNINIDGLNLQNIGEELARTYNLKVAVTHPEYDTNLYTINLNPNNVGLALKQLTLETGMSYKLENDHLTINPQNPRMK